MDSVQHETDVRIEVYHQDLVRLEIHLGGILVSPAGPVDVIIQGEIDVVPTCGDLDLGVDV